MDKEKKPFQKIEETTEKLVNRLSKEELNQLDEL